MKKRVFVLTNMMFLLLAGCGKSSEKKTSPIPNDKPTATEEKTTNKDTTSKPEVIKNRTKGAVFNSDINLSFFVADIKSAIKNLPVDVNYAVNSDGLLNLNGETAVEMKADLTKATSYQDKDGNTVSSTDAAIDNMNAFKSLVTIPQTFSKVTSLLSIPFSDVFPGQYKALGYEFTKMMNSIPKKTSSNETARANALKALEGESLSFYLNQTGQYFSETHQSGNDEKARAYTESISEKPSDSSTVTDIMELISILQEMDISEIQKLDFISLLENIQNGDIITDEMNEQLRAIYEKLRKYSDIFVGGMNVEKTGKTNEDGTVDAGFRFYLNDYGLSQLDKAFVDAISTMTGQKSEELESLLPQLKFTDATVAIDLYRGDDQYTHFGGCYFNFAFDVGNEGESKKSNNITMKLVMDHNNGENLSSDYFGSLEKRNQHYKKVSDEFNSYYEKIGKSVSYFDGDSNPGSLDISKENGDILDAAVILYDTLDDDTKFMLTDAVDKNTIKKNYDEGRDEVKKAASIYNTLYNLEEIKGSHSLVSASTAFDKAMEYKNWELAFKELDSSTYDKVLKVEKDALDSLESQIESYKTSISSLSDDASDAEIKAVLQTELSALRKEVKNYMPSTILGVPTDAKYSSSLFLTDELKEKRASLVTTALDGPLSQIESLNQDYYVNHLKKIVSDATKTGKEINDAFNSFVNTYHDTIVASLIGGSSAENNIIAKAKEQVKENYKSAVAPYFQELTDKAIAAYTKMKNENTDINKIAFTKAVNETKSVLRAAEECEKKAFGESLITDYSSFLGQLETMGSGI